MKQRLRSGLGNMLLALFSVALFLVGVEVFHRSRHSIGFGLRAHGLRREDMATARLDPAFAGLSGGEAAPAVINGYCSQRPATGRFVRG
jgi:hypothetical protein